MDNREEMAMAENETAAQQQVTFSAGSCVACGSMVQPGMEATHVAWHALLRAEAGTWVIPSGISR